MGNENLSAWKTMKYTQTRYINETSLLSYAIERMSRLRQVESNYKKQVTIHNVKMLHASKKITEKRLKWYGHLRRMKEEHTVRRMLDVDTPGKRRSGRPNQRWKDACKRDMAEVVLKEDKTTNRAAWRNTIISYTGDHR